MMNIKTQLITILISFLFGILFSVQVSFNYKLIYNQKKYYKITFTFLLVLVNTLLYFLLIRKFNDGILHPYGLLFIIVGYIVEIMIKSFIVKKIKK